MSLDLDEIRERALLTRDGFYHVVGAHRVMREADFDALVAEVERLREDAVVARSAETTLTVRGEARLAALLDAERENTALRAQRALDNDALARAWDEGRDMERAATVAYLRGEPERLVECNGHRHADGKTCFVMSPMPAEELADEIERGDHRREEKKP